MKKILVFLFSIVILSASNTALFARSTPLTVEQIQQQRPLAYEAYQEELKNEIRYEWVRSSNYSRKFILRKIHRLTNWQIPDSYFHQTPTKERVDLYLLDLMRNHLVVVGTSYLSLLCMLTDAQLEEFRNHQHYNIKEPAFLFPHKPNWQKDWSNLKTGLPHQTQLLHRLLAIDFMLDPSHVFDGNKYNYIHDRQQGMAPELMVQFAQELPWFGECVQDSFTAMILNNRYGKTSLDIDQMLSFVKQQPVSTQNIKEKVEAMKFEIGDKYMRQYLQTLKLDQTDSSLSLLDRLQAHTELQELPKKIEKVAQYCVTVHISANLLQQYDALSSSPQK